MSFHSRKKTVVRKLFNFIHKEFNGLHKAAYLIGTFAFLSQLLALVRDRMLAHTFGAGADLDVYYAAFRIPDIVFYSIASFVSITVLIPFLARFLKTDTERKDEARDFLSDVLSVFLISMAVISGLIYIAIPYLATFLVPGFSGEQQEVFISMTRLFLLSPILFGLSSLLGSVTQTYRTFFVYAGAPLLYNIGIIGGIILLAPLFGIMGVAYGVIIGAVLHMLAQIPVVIRHGLLPTLTWSIQWKRIKEVVALSLPRSIGLAANSITLLLLVALASLFAQGSIAVFNFSFNLQYVPLSIIGVSYSIAAFPTLAQLFSNGERAQFVSYVSAAMRHIIFWITPVTVLFIVLRAQIVRTILGSGSFSWSDTRLTAAALAVFSVSVLAHALVLLFVRAYYAAGKTAVPVIVNVVTMGITVGSAFLFVHIFHTVPLVQYFFESLLRIEGLAGSHIVMLALAYSVGVIINGVALAIFFVRDFGSFGGSIERVFAHSFASSIIMGFVAYRVLVILGDKLDLNTFWGVFLQGLGGGLAGIAAGVAVLYLLNNREIREVGNAFHARISGTRPIAPDREEL